jgi:very-short-patch-repair endonuclease
MLERALDQAEIDRLLRPGELQRTLARFPGHAGPPLVKAMLQARVGTTLTRSEAEERFLALVRASELPAPQANVPLHGYEVDFLWREAKLVVEIDGFRFHGPHSAFERDRRKDAKLAASGYTVIRFTWRELVDHPYVVVARLAQTLARVETG